jgi:hypothetical protein
VDKSIGFWSIPVYVRIGHGAPETISDASQALHYLMLRWPTERGEKYQGACIACANSAEFLGSAEDAREAFISAATKAHVLA